MATLTTVKKTKKTNSSEFCNARQGGGIAVFSIYCPNASIVQVAGDFNNWRPEQAPMRKADKKGYWETRLSMPSGRHCYRFVVDGKWQHDPSNNNTEPNPYGELNSVLIVS